jgi:hypothetical protein
MTGEVNLIVLPPLPQRPHPLAPEGRAMRSGHRRPRFAAAKSICPGNGAASFVVVQRRSSSVNDPAS